MRKGVFFFLLASLLFGCSQAPDVPEAQPMMASTHEEVSIVAHAIGNNFYGITLTNQLSQPVYFWPNAYVEKKIENTWQEVPVQSEIADSDVATLLDVDSSKDMLIDFNSRYGPVESGTYRISYAYSLVDNTPIDQRIWVSYEGELEFSEMAVQLSAQDLQAVLDENFDSVYKVIEPIEYQNGWHYHITDFNYEIITELNLKNIYFVQKGEGKEATFGFYYYEKIEANEMQEESIIFDTLFELSCASFEEVDPHLALFTKKDGQMIVLNENDDVKLNAKGYETMRENLIYKENNQYKILEKLTFKERIREED